MTTQQEVIDLISAGKYEFSLEESNRLFKDAATLAKTAIETSGDFLFCLLANEAGGVGQVVEKG